MKTITIEDLCKQKGDKNIMPASYEGSYIAFQKILDFINEEDQE